MYRSAAKKVIGWSEKQSKIQEVKKLGCVISGFLFSRDCTCNGYGLDHEEGKSRQEKRHMVEFHNGVGRC